MKGFVIASVVLGICALAGAQTGAPQLGEAKPVDLHVSAVDWHPGGQAFIYTRQEEKGQSLGMYSLGKYEGRTFLNLDKDDAIQTYWLSGSQSALIVVRGAPDAKTKATRLRFYIVDIDRDKMQKAFDESFDEKHSPGLDVDTSPLLKHAIIKITAGELSKHFVITPSGDLVASPDLDRAEKEGLSGPTWSVDGTAIYSNLTSSTTFRDVGRVFELTSANTVTSGGSDGDKVDTVKITSDVQELTSLAISITFRLMPPTPPTGSNVLELMPSNAILRPVRFRGPNVEKGAEYTPLEPQQQSIVLNYDRSNAQDTSVWIRRGKEKGTPASLVGVHVDETWLSPTESAVAYSSNGALFVHKIGAN